MTFLSIAIPLAFAQMTALCGFAYARWTRCDG